MKKTYRTNYYLAVHWLHNSFVRANNIGSLDPTIWDNMRFSTYWEDEDGEEHEREIYQYYLTDCSEFDVEFLEEHFGLLFTYSDALDLYVLCVDHWGTGWDYVEWDTDLENAEAALGEKK